MGVSFYTTTRRILGPIIPPFRTLSNDTSRPVRIFKGMNNIKSNCFVQPKRQPAIHFKKGNYREISQSPSLENLGVYPTFPAWTHQLMDEFRFKGGYIAPIAKFIGFPGMKKPSRPIAGWRWYAKAKEPGSPAPSKGGPVTTSGGGVGRLDAANESGFFHKLNKSRLEQIKQLLKEKSMSRGMDKDSKTDSK